MVAFLIDGIYRVPMRPLPPPPPPPAPPTTRAAPPRPAARTLPPPVTQSRLELQHGTAQRTHELEEASTQLAELQAARRSAPSGLRFEYDQLIADARRDVDEKKDALGTAVATQTRQAAQTTQPDVRSNLYRSQADELRAHDVDPAARDVYVEAVEAGVQQAQDSEPANVYEAQWQRNAQIWEAETAQYELEQKLSGQPAIEGPNGLLDPTLQADRVHVEQQWQDVRDAFATEYEVVKLTPRSPLPPGYDPLAAHRASVANESFDLRYRERILASASTGETQSDVEAAVDARVDAEVQKVEAAMAGGGSSAALDAMVASKDGLAGSPVSVNGQPADDPVVLALAQRLDERLRPIQERIAADAPADLQSRADAPADTTQQRYARAKDVSSRLALYTTVLPSDLVSQVVEQSRGAWAPQIAFLGEQSRTADSSHPNPGQRYVPNGATVFRPSEAFGDVVADFMDVGEALADSPGGDTALDAMAGEFANAIDRDDIGAFDEAFGEQGAGDGHGLHLAVQTVNRLAADESTRDRADDLLEGLEHGNEKWVDRARGTLDDFAKNREELITAINTFPGSTRVLATCDLRDTTDPTALELRDAIHDYLLQPDGQKVSRKDEELLRQIDADGRHLLHTELALQGLSPEALKLEHADVVVEPMRSFLEPDEAEGPGLWEIYSGTPGVRVEMANFASLLAAHDEAIGGTGSGTGDGNLLADFARWDGQSMTRNARFMALELMHPSTGAAPMSILGSDTVQARVLRSGVKTSGVVFFAAAAGNQFLNASNFEGWDQAVALTKGVTYSYIGARDLVELGAIMTKKQSLTNLLWATGPDGKTYHALKLANGQTSEAFIGLAKTLGIGSRAVFVATDIYTLTQDWNRSGGVVAADWVSLAGSGTMLVEAGVVAFAPAAAIAGVQVAGPLAWIGTGLWTAGAIMKYHFERVEQSNRFETAQMRRFLSHFGTRDDDGNLRTFAPDAEIEVSNSTDHDPDRRTVRFDQLDGVPDGDIVYRGISLDSVDELMNFSGSPEHPESPIPVLDTLAVLHGVDSREMYLRYFNGLSHEQRKELAVAAHGVDLDGSRGGGITDASLQLGFGRQWEQMNSLGASFDPDRVSEEARAGLIDYVIDHKVVTYDASSGAVVTEVDASKLRLLLGLRDAERGEQAPSADVRAAAQHVLADTAQYGRDEVNGGGFRPKTPDELAYWMELHGYPALPSPTVACDPGARPVPQPLALAVDEPPPPKPDFQDPAVDHRYIVQPGDNLWDIAGATMTPTDLEQLVEYHNAHNPQSEADFDVARADRNFFTPHDPDDHRRDPDLIHPGEVIYVVDVADIRKA